MTPPRPERARRDFSQPVKQMVATASDEQLAWIVGPDRRYYSKEAVAAATRELEIRRESNADQRDVRSYNVAAFVFGPLWYFYHGMIGRGVLVLAVLLAAIFGFEPVADAIGIPAVLWVLIVLLSVGGYCSRFADRDLAESRLQARLAARKPIVHSRRPPPEETLSSFVAAAQVGCPAAGEHAKAALAAEGITAIVKSDDDSSEGANRGASATSNHPTRVLVHDRDLQKAQKLLKSLLATLENDRSSLCGDEDKQ